MIKLPQERVHLLEYGFLAFLVYKALRIDIRDERIYLFTSLLVMFFGLADECIQFLLPNRYFGIMDVLVNGVSGILGTMILCAQDRG